MSRTADSPFFALRSCHQLLRGDSGEFFSPDYLCSNPPLWCNWTIQVTPGKRIQLHLEDLTPDDLCHLKQDQVHVDEPAGYVTGHRILQKCWREARYTSSSNTLHVVLLIGGQPSPPFRGFYGRYQAFGPPVLYHPQEGFTERSRQSESSPGHVDVNESGPAEPDLQQHPLKGHSDLTYEYYDQHLAVTADLPWEDMDHTDDEVDGDHHPSSAASSTPPLSTGGTSRSGRGANQTTSDLFQPAVQPASPQNPTAIRRNVEEAAADHQETAAPEAESSAWTLSEEDTTEVTDPSHLLPPTSDRTAPEEAEPTHPQPNMVEPLSDHRGHINSRNLSDRPHLPGDHLFEVDVEVHFSQDVDESWDDLTTSLLPAVNSLISEQLQALHTPLDISAKRIKRLSAGVLYILWLQVGQGPGDLHVHREVHSALESLKTMHIGAGGGPRRAAVAHVSMADVNECGSHLVLCDSNADCVNQFGSYLCRCRSGFQDKSRLGTGGTVCVDAKAAGCRSGLSAETKGVYVLFFLLSSLILMLLAAAGMLYHRRHRGAFLVRCHSNSSLSPPNPNNNNSHHHHHHHPHHGDFYSSPPDSDLPPPPPPVRGLSEGWSQVKERCHPVDLPLLRFSPLLPPDAGYTEPQEGGKKK
ncbi:uncharacterized protein V6R79_008820 [Siganus canaliculatus]